MTISVTHPPEDESGWRVSRSSSDITINALRGDDTSNAGGSWSRGRDLPRSVSVRSGTSSSDFSVQARVEVEYSAALDEGAVFIASDGAPLAQIALLLTPDGHPCVRTSVWSPRRDDASAFLITDGAWFRIVRRGTDMQLFASPTGRSWSWLRSFTLPEDVAHIEVGFSASSPLGEGCWVRFSDIELAG